jgi:beta-xylosidase
MTTPAFTVGQPLGAPPVRDDFDATSLHPRWVSVRSRPAESYSLSARPGWLTLHARGSGLDDRAVTFVGRRQQHPTCRVRARFETSVGSGGLAVRLDERHHYAVDLADGEVSAQARVGQLAQRFGVRQLPPGPVVLRIEVEPGPAGFNTGDKGGGPDLIRLGFESDGEGNADGEANADGEFIVLAELDGRYLSTEVAGGFTGRVIGMYAATGTIHFDWFDYTGD